MSWGNENSGGDGWNTTADTKWIPAPEQSSDAAFKSIFNEDNAETGLSGAVGDEHHGDGGCRNCGDEGHFARDCPEPRKMSGECFNCGETGHNKSDCTNPRVARAFTGTCRHCNEEGHMAAECPTKPADVCRNCTQAGHKAANCTENRKIDRSKVLDMDKTEAWRMLVKASQQRDMDDFKEAFMIYTKAQPELSFQDLEKQFRAANFSVYLIANEKDIPITITNVNLQGKQDCKFVIGFYFSPKPKRAKFAEGWPADADENLERLADAGEPMDKLAVLCRNCKELGHVSKNCPEDRVEFDNQPNFKCDNCNEEGHRLRDCPKPRIDRDACKNCGQSGHRAADCTEERSAANVECRNCNEMGHFSKDCPTGGGPRTCRNCGSEDHMAKECDQPRNPATVTCRNCDELGHLSKECPKPRDYSRVKCSNCGEMGHTQVRCKQPMADVGAGGDGGFGDAGFSDNAGNGGFARSDNGGAPISAGGW